MAGAAADHAGEQVGGLAVAAAVGPAAALAEARLARANSSSETSGRCSTSETTHSSSARSRAVPPASRWVAKSRRFQTRRSSAGHLHRILRHRQPDEEWLPAARRHQQGGRHPLRLVQRKSTRSATSTSRCWREMRDAAGDSGEFYTPRPVVRFMVAASPTRSLAKRSSTPPAAPAASWSRRISHLETQVKDRAATAGCSRSGALRRGAEAAAVPALPDEPAAARPGRAADRPGQQPAPQAHARSARRTGST